MLLNKIIIITGASDGMGRVIAEKLAIEHRATVILTARRKKILEEIAKKIQQNGGEALVVPADLCEPDEIKKIVQKTVQKYGRIDVLINVAGMGYYDWIEENTADDVRVQFMTNVVGMTELIRQVTPIMKKQRSGQIINFASYASQIAAPPLTIYSSTKYAIEGLSDALRRELAPWNIMVTRVHPSAVDTDFNKKAAGHSGIVYPYDKLTGVTKEKVATEVIKAIYHPRQAIYVARFRFLLDAAVFINRYFPGLIDLVMRVRVPKMWGEDTKHDLQS
jgi:short-subunit dehydrogenase